MKKQQITLVAIGMLLTSSLLLCACSGNSGGTSSADQSTSTESTSVAKNTSSAAASEEAEGDTAEDTVPNEGIYQRTYGTSIRGESPLYLYGEVSVPGTSTGQPANGFELAATCSDSQLFAYQFDAAGSWLVFGEAGKGIANPAVGVNLKSGVVIDSAEDWFGEAPLFFTGDGSMVRLVWTDETGEQEVSPWAIASLLFEIDDASDGEPYIFDYCYEIYDNQGVLTEWGCLLDDLPCTPEKLDVVNASWDEKIAPFLEDRAESATFDTFMILPFETDGADAVITDDEGAELARYPGMADSLSEYSQAYLYEIGSNAILQVSYFSDDYTVDQTDFYLK